MSDLSNSKRAKPNDDPALAMAILWHRECDQLEDAASFASQRERAMLDALPEHEQEAKRVFQEAAKVRDRLSDKLERLTRAIFKCRAHTFEGAAAKLAVAIRDSAPLPDDPMPPWVYLRSVQTDLDRLVADLKAQAANDDEPNG